MANNFTQLLVVVIISVGCNKLGFMQFGGGGEKKPKPISNNNTKRTVETFVPQISSQNLLDILLVIDNSSSMRPVHQGLSERLSELLSTVSKSDWQIAITTSDPRDCVGTIINKQTAGYQEIFRKAVSSLDAKGTTHAQPIRMAVAGLKSNCDKKSWLRDKSTVAVLIITDEDNYTLQCGDVSLKNENFIDKEDRLDPKHCHVETLYRYLQQIRIPRVTARVYGLLNDRKKSQFMSWRDQYGKSIFDHIGHIENKADYHKILNEISQNISAAMQRTYTLKNKGDAKIATVTVSHQLGKRKLTPAEYQINGNLLTITNTLPTATTSIEVTYY